MDPIQSRADTASSLNKLFARYGIPKTIVPDNAKELTEGDFARTASRAACQIHPIEAYTPNQNIAETGIREILQGYGQVSFLLLPQPPQHHRFVHHSFFSLYGFYHLHRQKNESLVLKIRGAGEGEGGLFQTDSVFRNLGKPLPPSPPHV